MELRLHLGVLFVEQVVDLPGPSPEEVDYVARFKPQDLSAFSTLG